MIKLGVLTTVWRRPMLTTFHFKWMNQFRSDCADIGIEVYPYYVLSEDDRSKSLFKSFLGKYGYNYSVLPSMRLSDKSQAGLDALRDSYTFDWLMHLDSDEILSMQLMKKWKKEFEKETLWFGSRSCYFVNVSTNEAFEFKGYSDHPVKNGGTCLSREIVERAGQLWTKSRSTGLNVDERKRLEKLGYHMQPIDTQHCFGVVELKGEKGSIHPLSWFHKRNLLKELDEGRMEELLTHHTMLRNIIQ